MLLFSLGFMFFLQQAGAQALTAKQIVSNPEVLHARLRMANPDYRDQAQFADDPEVRADWGFQWRGSNGPHAASGHSISCP